MANLLTEVDKFLTQFPNPIAYLQQKAQQAGNYFNPTSNAGQNFWSTPVAQKLGQAQQIVQQQYTPQNIVRSAIPMVNYPQYTQNVGQQLQKVNLPQLNIPAPLKAGIPALQLPEQINAYAQSYGRTLAAPGQNKLEAGLNLLPFLPVGRVKAVVPKDFSTAWLDQGAETLAKVKPTIGALESQINGLIGHSPGGMNWKMEYRVREQLLNYAKQEAPVEVKSQITKLEGLIDNIRNIREEKATAKQIATGLPQLKEDARIRQAQAEVQKLLKVPKVQDWLKGLDQTAFKVIRDWTNQAQAVLAQPTAKTAGKIAQRGAADLGRLAKIDYGDWQGQLFKQEGAMTARGAMETITGGIQKATKSPLVDDIANTHDISGFTGQARDVFRNFRAVFGNNFQKAKDLILDPFDAAKGKFVNDFTSELNALEKNIVSKGIKLGSKESELVQMFGEGNITQAELRSQSPTGWQEIIKADEWFRGAYDKLLNEVNAVRAKIYPNNPQMIIPRREDYYRHFREIAQGYRGLLNIFDSPANIASSLSGISEYTLPKSKWLSFAQRRLGVKSDIDAVGGFLDYLKSATYAKNIDPQVAKFRALADELATATDIGTDNAGRLNNFIEFLHDFSNDLAGKTNPADRFIQKTVPGGRRTFRAINWLNNRVKANVILGNVSASLAQIFNVPQGIAQVGPLNAVKGLGRSLASMFVENKPMAKSTFIKERYFNAFDRFNTGLLDQPYKFAKWMVTALDEVGTKYIWNSAYEQAREKGIVNAAKYADDVARGMVAGRGIGEVPLLQKSKLFQLVAPFQVEVANLWWVMKDFVDERAFGKIATLFVMNYIFNRGAERIRGTPVTFDPLQATIEAVGQLDKENGWLLAGGRIGGEVLSNVPFGQTIAAVYPEYGFKVGENQYPTRKQLFGREDPTRFGGGALFTRGLTDPLYKILPPFGGQQIKRTIEGLGAYGKGFAESAKGLVQYPISQSPTSLAQSAVFGKYAVPEAQQYFKTEAKPLGKVQSQAFKQAQDRLATYKEIIAKREQTTQENQVKEIVANTGINSYYLNKYFYLKDGEVKSVDTSFQPQAPKLTGNETLDEKLIAKYKGQITSKSNDIIELYEQGQLTADEAEKQLSDLVDLKNKLAAVKIKKPKKITAKKLPVIKIAKVSPGKIVGIKIKALPKLKLAKQKNIYTSKKVATIKGPKKARITFKKAGGVLG